MIAAGAFGAPPAAGELGGAAVVTSIDTAEPASLTVVAPPPNVAVELATELAAEDDMASDARGRKATADNLPKG